MLRVDGKKINAAFGRLRQRRAAVGIESTAETPEEEANRVKREIAAAQATGDIATILHIITQSSSLTTEDFIKKTCGGLLFVYYVYLKELHSKPVDIDDLIDGLLFLDAQGYITKKMRKEQK